MTQRLFRVELRSDQVLHLGVGRGSGFSGATRRFVPGSTLRGALCAAWWREHPHADPTDFEALIAGFSVGDAVPGPAAAPDDAPVPSVPRAVPLDRVLCKYPTEACPAGGHPWTVETCPVCGGRTEPAKAQRSTLGGCVFTATRVALTGQEQAEEDRLFAREGLQVAPGTLLVALAAGDVDRLAAPGQVLRIGAATSVAGRAVVESVRPYAVPRLPLGAGEHRLRIELLTAAVFVDDFGFAASAPSADDLASAFGLLSDSFVTLERAFTRWSTASGWHSAANVPKPEDAVVVAHSAYHLTVETPVPMEVPRVVHDLGLRTAEGYGWAMVEPLAGGPGGHRGDGTADGPGQDGEEAAHHA